MALDIAGLINKPEKEIVKKDDKSSDEETGDISQLIRNPSIREVQPVRMEQPRGKRTVLRRITKIPRLEGGYTVKVEFIANEQEVDGFKKK